MNGYKPNLYKDNNKRMIQVMFVSGNESLFTNLGKILSCN